jgi:hypothetical protein
LYADFKRGVHDLQRKLDNCDSENIMPFFDYRQKVEMAEENMQTEKQEG